MANYTWAGPAGEAYKAAHNWSLSGGSLSVGDIANIGSSTAGDATDSSAIEYLEVLNGTALTPTHAATLTIYDLVSGNSSRNDHGLVREAKMSVNFVDYHVGLARQDPLIGNDAMAGSFIAGAEPMTLDNLDDREAFSPELRLEEPPSLRAKAPRQTPQTVSPTITKRAALLEAVIEAAA